MKQKTGKKLLCLLFTSVMIVSLFPWSRISAYADSEFTLTYDANGADGDPDLSALNSTYAEGEKVIVAAFPAENKLMKDGAEISAWNTQADGKGVSYMPSDEIEVSDSIVLYAQFDIVEGIQDGVDEQSDQSILKSVLALGKNNNEQNTVNTASEAHTHNEITFSEWTSTNSLPSE